MPDEAMWSAFETAVRLRYPLNNRGEILDLLSSEWAFFQLGYAAGATGTAESIRAAITLADRIEQDRQKSQPTVGDVLRGLEQFEAHLSTELANVEGKEAPRP